MAKLFKKKQKKSRKKFPLLVIIPIASAIFVFGLFNYNQDPEHTSLVCKDCNVILISIDTLRADHLGTYGYYRNTSPNIDKLALKSILFESAISQETWTIPSHISIFTSLYPLSHKVLGLHDFLNTDVSTLPEILKSDGYATAAFTGRGLTIEPNIGLGRGFDVYKQINYSGAKPENLKNPLHIIWTNPTLSLNGFASITAKNSFCSFIHFLPMILMW